MNLQQKYISRVSVMLMMLVVPLAHGHSLWLKATNNERGMFADRVAANIGDIITITVNETTVENLKYKMETKQKSKFLGVIRSWLFPNSSFGNHGGDFPAPDWELTNNDFSGEGTVGDTSTLTFNTSAFIIDRLPNGNLVLQGKREIVYANETRYFVISGIIRPDDITSANTVDSDLIADAEVKIITEGELSSVRRKGWLTRLADFVNPF